MPTSRFTASSAMLVNCDSFPMLAARFLSAPISFAGMLRSRGVEFENEPFYVEVLDLWVSFIYDPAGALVEISEGLDHL